MQSPPCYTVTGHQTFATAANTWWIKVGARVLKNVRGNWLRGKAIIKPGRLEPHPIQRRGQRLGRPSSFFEEPNLDNEGRPTKIPSFSENYKKKYFKCNTSKSVSMPLSIGICVCSRGRISCVVVDFRVRVITCLVLNSHSPRHWILRGQLVWIVYSFPNRSIIFVLLFRQIRGQDLGEGWSVW